MDIHGRVMDYEGKWTVQVGLIYHGSCGRNYMTSMQTIMKKHRFAFVVSQISCKNVRIHLVDTKVYDIVALRVASRINHTLEVDSLSLLLLLSARVTQKISQYH